MRADDPNFVPYVGTEFENWKVPTVEGPAGKAWLWDLPDEVRERFPASKREYLMCVPGSNPFWWWYVLMLIDLRDHEGSPPAHKEFIGAQYEIRVNALSPEHPVPEPTGDAFSPDVPVQLVTLDPPDQIHQLGAMPRQDVDACEFLDKVATAVVNGHLPPDSDFRATWKRSMELSYEHVTTGGHGGHSHG